MGRMLVLLGMTLLAALPVNSATAAVFFEDAGTPSVFQTALSALRAAAVALPLTDTVVSRFRLLQIGAFGFRPFSFYRPRTVTRAEATQPPTTGARGEITAPAPTFPGVPSLAGARWASDCSCRRGDPCPDNPDVPCEQCRPITIGDADTTVADCQRHRHAPTNTGGSTTLEGHI